MTLIICEKCQKLMNMLIFVANQTVMGEVFRIIPEFRILRLTFHWKSASNSWITLILMASLIWIKFIWRQLTTYILKLVIFIGIVQVLRFDFQKFRILEILNFHPWTVHVVFEFIYGIHRFFITLLIIISEDNRRKCLTDWLYLL